jgi:DNA-directed RNA polymerase III subunit RPC11
MLLCMLPYFFRFFHVQANGSVCPSCSNVLTVSTTTSPTDHTPTNRLECQTCPYQFILERQYYERKTFARKEREDVFGGPGAWDNADKAQIQCPKEGCGGEEAAFFQVQIRSADEPMTSFYKVTSRDPKWQGEAILLIRYFGNSV